MPFLVGVHREDGSHPFFQGHGLDCVQEMGLEALDFYLNFRPPGVGGVGVGVGLCHVIRILGSFPFLWPAVDTGQTHENPLFWTE